MIVELLLFFLGLAALAKSSSVVVDSATRISVFFGISTLTIGFILLSISTSLPELTVSIISAAKGEAAIAAGNVFGSNIANILLILGIGSVLYNLKIPKSSIKDVAIGLVLTTVLSGYIILNTLLESKALGIIEGMVLIALFAAYSLYVYSRNQQPKGEAEVTGTVSKQQALTAFLMFAGSIIVVLFSSSVVVDSAVFIPNWVNTPLLAAARYSNSFFLN